MNANKVGDSVGNFLANPWKTTKKAGEKLSNVASAVGASGVGAVADFRNSDTAAVAAKKAIGTDRVEVTNALEKQRKVAKHAVAVYHLPTEGSKLAAESFGDAHGKAIVGMRQIPVESHHQFHSRAQELHNHASGLLNTSALNARHVPDDLPFKIDPKGTTDIPLHREGMQQLAQSTIAETGAKVDAYRTKYLGGAPAQANPFHNAA